MSRCVQNKSSFIYFFHQQIKRWSLLKFYLCSGCHHQLQQRRECRQRPTAPSAVWDWVWRAEDRSRWDPKCAAGTSEPSGCHKHPEKPTAKNDQTFKKRVFKPQTAMEDGVTSVCRFPSYLTPHPVVAVWKTSMTPLTEETQLKPLSYSFFL